MKSEKVLRFRRPSSLKRRGATTRTYTAEWFPGASVDKRLAWRHEPDLDERWASMDYDERWNLTVILDPSVLTPNSLRNEPMCWELLLEKWRSYKRGSKWGKCPEPIILALTKFAYFTGKAKAFEKVRKYVERRLERRHAEGLLRTLGTSAAPNAASAGDRTATVA